MIAWRRWDEVPTPPPIAWLLVTARKVIQNRARASRRNRALEERIALLDRVAAYVTDSADTALTRREALERLARLDEQHREALLLVSWDGLSNDEAAAVLGIRPATSRRRISRARDVLLAPSPRAIHRSRTPTRPRAGAVMKTIEDLRPEAGPLDPRVVRQHPPGNPR